MPFQPAHSDSNISWSSEWSLRRATNARDRTVASAATATAAAAVGWCHRWATPEVLRHRQGLSMSINESCDTGLNYPHLVQHHVRFLWKLLAFIYCWTNVDYCCVKFHGCTELKLTRTMDQRTYISSLHFPNISCTSHVHWHHVCGFNHAAKVMSHVMSHIPSPSFGKAATPWLAQLQWSPLCEYDLRTRHPWQRSQLEVLGVSTTCYG